MSATLPAGITLRPWREGDDLRLLELWGDPDTPQQHQDRTLLSVSREPGAPGEPFSVCLVAEDGGVPVAAGAVASSKVHPQRLWLYVETAREQRRRGIATALVAGLREAAAFFGPQELKSRYALGAGERSGSEAPAEGFLHSLGMRPLQRSRRIGVGPGSLALPSAETVDDQPAIEDLATGSVELTQAVVAFYTAVHDWDPAEMTVGRAQQQLLAETTGASGAVVLRDRPKAEGGTIQSFAISYTPERTEDPADVLLGWNPLLDGHAATEAVFTLLSLLTAQYPVQLEVDDAMGPLLTVVDPLVTTGHAQVLLDTRIWATDAAQQ